MKGRHIKRCIPYIGIAMWMLANISESKAQTESKAQQHFDRREYALAIPEYEKELARKKIPRAEQALIEGHIGMSYYYLNQPKEAVSRIKKAITYGYQTAAIYRINGLALQKQEKYDEALASFRECLKIEPNEADVQRHIASCEYALAHPQPNARIKLRSSKINTDGSEYGISSAGDIFFSRAATKGRDIDPRTGLGFTEVYSAKFEKDDLTNPRKEDTFMKTYYNTGVFAFDSLTSYMYTTVCDPKSGHCGIYRSKLNRRKWGKPEPFFINENHDMAHPALARNGTRLYFTSNASGGYGKTDIWYADLLADEQWSEPVNVGQQVNTPGRDEFPFVENDKTLYFASDGHPGFGGLDIFTVALDGDRHGTPENPGRPINSGADDFNMITAGDRGLLISSRNLPKSDDIYIFNKKELPPPTALAEVPEEKAPEPVQSEPKVAQPAPQIAASEPKPTQPEHSTPIQSDPKPIPSDSKPAQPEHSTPVVSEPESVRPDPVSTRSEPPIVQSVPVPSEPRNPKPETQSPEPKVRNSELETFYYDFNLFVPQREYRDMYEETATLMKNHPNTKYVIEGFADDRGGDAAFNRELSEKRAQYLYDRMVDRGVKPAMLRIEGFGNTNPAVPNASTEEEYRLNRRAVIRIDR